MGQGTDEMTLTPTLGLGAALVFSLGLALPQSIPVSLCASAQSSFLLSGIYAWVGQGLERWGKEHTSLEPFLYPSALLGAC